MKTGIELRSQRVVASRTGMRDSITDVFNPYRGPYLMAKLLMDRVAAVFLLILLSPVMLVAALAVKVTSRGPVFYRQPRLGRGGHVFQVWKFRTMIDNAEAGTGPVWSTAGDPRITKIGKILRDTHIDEFPQLLNVLGGAMSLVGPRPERPEIASELQTKISAYQLRLMIRPGITGFAQVRLPPDSDLEGVRRKLAHDLYYIQHLSLLMDLKILLRTGWSFVWSVGDVTVKTARLPRKEVVEKLVPYLLDESAARETFAPAVARPASEARAPHEDAWQKATLASQ